jgi:transposase
MRQSKDPKYLRLEMVRYAKEHGIKPAAREFSTTPKTVRKWLRRWDEKTFDSLEAQSRAPKNPARKILPDVKQRVIELKRKLPSWGAQRTKRDFDIPISEKAIRSIWRQEGLLKRPRRKHRTKQDLREMKAKWRLFEQTCLDTKDLIDIPEMYLQLKRLQLPKVQYTAREVVSGLQFIAYAQERSLIFATLFAEIIIDHLLRCGVSLKNCRFQTDNGSEFIGAWNARSDSSFTNTVQAVKGLVHQTIPPAAHTWQADVETVHSTIENEFYCVESFSSRNDFLNKASAYILWYNVARKNSSKNNKTPFQIIARQNNSILPQVATLTPVFLDQLWKLKLESHEKRAYDLIQYP